MKIDNCDCVQHVYKIKLNNKIIYLSAKPQVNPIQKNWILKWYQIVMVCYWCLTCKNIIFINWRNAQAKCKRTFKKLLSRKKKNSKFIFVKLKIEIVDANIKRTHLQHCQTYTLNILSRQSTSGWRLVIQTRPRESRFET